MSRDKRQTLIDALLHSPHPLSGDELASRLHVSSRTVRQYVRDINAKSQVIAATHRGYSLDRRGYEELRRSGKRTAAPETPDQRLYYICRDLVKRSDPVSIFTLSELLCVSESTLESDLARARELFRQHDLVLRRDHDLVRVEGPERSRRRLVRQVLHNSAKGIVPVTWKTFASEYAQLDVKGLRESVAKVIDASELEFNEYALSDLIVHLTTTLDRVMAGNTLPSSGWTPPLDDPLVLEVTTRLAAFVAGRFGVDLPEAEIEALYSVIAVRAVRGTRQETAERVVDPQTKELVSELLDEIAHRYLLGPADHSMLLNLALHVQNMIARAAAQQSLVNPLGDEFKNAHPLLHDMALFFAGQLEKRLGIRVHEGEVDYLSFHMGMQFLRSLEQRDLVTITLVVPKYYDMATSVSAQLEDSVRGQAVIEQTITTIDVDLASITSDLIVSCIDPGGPTSAPVIKISPFLTTQDIDRVLGAVRLERDRNSRRRVRAALTTLIDPQLFFHLPSVGSKEAALAMMCGRMASAGYVEATFLDDVLDRERRSSTSFGAEFAIPHSMYMDANATAISVLVSDKGISWGGSVVRLVVLFALSPEGRQTFRDGLDEITRLLSERANITVLVNAAGSFDEFMAALVSLLDS